MKKFRFSILALFAIILGIAASSFTNKQSSPVTLSDTWYKLTPNADPSLASNYYFDSNDPNPDCASSPEIVCAIKVQDNGSQPNQADVDALMSATSDFTQSNVLVKYRE